MSIWARRRRSFVHNTCTVKVWPGQVHGAVQTFKKEVVIHDEPITQTTIMSHFIQGHKCGITTTNATLALFRMYRLHLTSSVTVQETGKFLLTKHIQTFNLHGKTRRASHSHEITPRLMNNRCRTRYLTSYKLRASNWIRCRWRWSASLHENNQRKDITNMSP